MFALAMAAAGCKRARPEEVRPGAATARVCVDANGRVTSVQVLRSTLPDELTRSVADKLRAGRFLPPVRDAGTAPSCSDVKYEIKVGAP
jgi:TonB family protein